MAAVLWIRRTGRRALASAHAWLRSHIIDDSDRWHSEGDIDGEAIFYIIADDLKIADDSRRPRAVYEEGPTDPACQRSLQRAFTSKSI